METKQTAVEFIIEQLDCLKRERKENLIDATSDGVDDLSNEDLI
jgi:hypothetical protein